MIIRHHQFQQLAENRSGFIKSVANKMVEDDPDAFLTEDSLEQLIETCRTIGRKKDADWLQNLWAMHKSGQLQRILSGRQNHNDHTAEVAYLASQQTIPFGLNDAVIEKETGKTGQVIDYNVDTGRYIVALNPFQIKDFEAKDLMKGKGTG